MSAGAVIGSLPRGNLHLKAFGQIIKSLFILRYVDYLELRQAIEKQLNKVELANRFTRAVAVGSPREFIQAEKEEQEIAEACNRLIKNSIICWNYLYLARQIEKAPNAEARDKLLSAIAAHSPMSWAHINMLGEYDCVFRWGGRPLRHRNVQGSVMMTATRRRPWTKLAKLELILRRTFFIYTELQTKGRLSFAKPCHDHVYLSTWRAMIAVWSRWRLALAPIIGAAHSGTSGHPFRSHPATHSDHIRPPVPTHSATCDALP